MITLYPTATAPATVARLKLIAKCSICFTPTGNSGFFANLGLASRPRPGARLRAETALAADSVAWDVADCRPPLSTARHAQRATKRSRIRLLVAFVRFEPRGPQHRAPPDKSRRVMAAWRPMATKKQTEAARKQIAEASKPRAKRQIFAEGHKRKFLVVVDETPECESALAFAASRALRTQGQLALLYVIEPGVEFSHWLGVEESRARRGTTRPRPCSACSAAS